MKWLRTDAYQLCSDSGEWTIDTLIGPKSQESLVKRWGNILVYRANEDEARKYVEWLVKAEAA